MIKPAALLPVIDNSGAIKGGCINIPKQNQRIGAVPACLITISVKKNVFKKNIKKKSRIISKGQLVKALLVTTVKGVRRKGSFFIRSSANSILLMNQYILPYGTRILGPVFREIKQKTKYRKALNLAGYIL